MSSTVTIPTLRPYSSTTTESEVRPGLGHDQGVADDRLERRLGPVAHVEPGEAVVVDDPLDPVAVAVFDHDQPRVAGGDAAPQRRLDGLGGIDGDHRRDRRHHLARLLLVQVEDAAEHPRFARVEVPPRPRAVDDLLQVLGGVVFFEVLRVDAEEADDAVGDPAQRLGHRGGRHGEPAQRAGDAAGGLLGVGDRQHLRHLLADRDVDRGDEGEGDRQRERRGGAVGEVAEDRLQQLRQRGLAEETDPDRGDGDADLAGGEGFVDAVELLDHGLGPGFSLLGSLFEFAAAAAHERELGRDEEAVDRDQQQQKDEQQDAHRLCGPVLRAGTSSAMRLSEYSYLSSRSSATMRP